MEEFRGEIGFNGDKEDLFNLACSTLIISLIMHVGG